ncbi:hypothetical protein DERP_011369 [Dermatophagoides pteronyssinus]|uniref:Uncharacterized protein n=1 Tax=Dermatophagoides pteronyssinus TaxID=6956 RepID=A0ABQ8J7D7_DERPT|nr:hypothetical protein DERP_011369 [Dermatophagoides pteronyssinus]
MSWLDDIRHVPNRWPKLIDMCVLDNVECYRSKDYIDDYYYYTTQLSLNHPYVDHSSLIYLQ